MVSSAVVTGGSSGIGRALTRQLADAGVEVLTIGRRMDALKETASHNVKKIGYMEADLSSAEDIDRIQKEAGSLPSPLAVFHGAGIFQIGRMSELDLTKWTHSFAINVTARFLLTQKLISLLDKGRILFIGSDAGINVRTGAGAYSIAQSASASLMEVLKKELLEKNIAVGSFKPGLVETEMVRTFLKTPESIFPDVRFYRNWIEQGQIAPPETIASFARWLLLETEEHEFVNTAWDVRDTRHHEKWLKGEFY